MIPPAIPAARRAVRLTRFAAVTAGMFAGYVAHDTAARGHGRSDLRDPWIRRWTGAVLRGFGVRVLASGQAAGVGERGRLIVSNHRSAIDIAVLLHLFGGRMVSRADLAGWPLLGFAARRIGTVFVDRQSRASGAATIRTIRDLLRQGETVIVFAEGTTFPDDEVRPFHAGAFMAADDAGAQIVPVGLAYPQGSGAAFFGESFVAHLSRVAAAPPDRVAVCVGDAQPTSGASRPAELAASARAAVARLVSRARSLCDQPPPTR